MPAIFHNLKRAHYGAILADPPWRFRLWSGATAIRSSRTRDSNAIHYKTLALDELRALPVTDLAADDCALFLWATWPNLLDAFSVIDAWGFEYKTCAFAWTKLSRSGQRLHFGMGYWTRANTEPCLLATRGSPTRLARDVPQVILRPVAKHSAKPAIVRERIMRLVPGPYLELFARERTKGWSVWGNELRGSRD